MTTVEKLNINDILGHYVVADVSLKGYYGKIRHTLEGRIIYSGSNASLFFKPKGRAKYGYFIESEDDIHSVNIIRKYNEDNKYYVEAYTRRELYEKLKQERLEAERQKRLKEEQERKENALRMEEKRKRKVEQEIEEAKALGGYTELEKEVIDFYKSFEGDFFNESFIKTTYVPILNKLIHKAIKDVNSYPKYYFCKKNNPKFTSLIEKKLNIKLGKTQKGNVEILNNYLSS